MNISKRALALATPLALALTMTACDNNNNDTATPTPSPTATTPTPPPPTPSPSPTPAPTPSPTATSTTPTGTVDVSQCLTQEVAPNVSVASLVIPDTLTLDFNADAGFPNGRRVGDPVANVTEAVLLLDLTAQTAGGEQQTALSFQQLPPSVSAALGGRTSIDVPQNDVNYAMGDMTMAGGYPWLGAAQGSPPRADSTGTTFNFRSQPDTSYVRVDRMGMPAVSTALIAMDRKVAYNDADPIDDANMRFVGDLTAGLTKLHVALRDDLISLGFVPCSTSS